MKDNQNEINDGDVRISFHEIKEIVNATILAAKNDDFLSSYEIQQLGNKNINCSVMIGGKEQVINIGVINFIKEGIIPKEQFI